MDALAGNVREGAPGALEEATAWWQAWTATHAGAVALQGIEALAAGLLDTQYARFFPSLLR